MSERENQRNHQLVNPKHRPPPPAPKMGLQSGWRALAELRKAVSVQLPLVDTLPGSDQEPEDVGRPDQWSARAGCE